MVWSGALVLVTVLFGGFSPPYGTSWRWPLRPPVQITRPFDPPAHPWEAGHRGVDLAARPGQAVYAAGAGRVGFARDLAGRGVVTVIHGRLRTTYLPVRPAVRAGRIVAAGTRIGVVEDVMGHCGQAVCLHWGLRQGVTYFDPLSLLGRGPVRLLPWWNDGRQAAQDEWENGRYEQDRQAGQDTAQEDWRDTWRVDRQNPAQVDPQNTGREDPQNTGREDRQDAGQEDRQAGWTAGRMAD